MKKTRQFIECFVTVATGILIIAAFIYPSQPEKLTPTTLRQILLSAGLCALATVLFFPDENASKMRIVVGISLHFVSLCAIMTLCGRWFGWIDESFVAAAAMVGYVVIVYAFTTGITCIMEKRQAAELNARLKENFPDNAPEEK